MLIAPAHSLLLQMDWIGDKITQLIEEGKRALGTEIVLASEAPEDEMDDGRGDWADDDDMSGSRFSSSSRRSRNHNSYSVPSTTTPRRIYYNRHPHSRSEDLSASTSALPSTPDAKRSHVTEALSSSYTTETEWSSPQLRESMERARAAYRLRQGLQD